MANIKISELNELYPAQKDYGDYLPIVDISADETKKISVQSLTANGVQLIDVTDTAPEEYETGDKYYNTTNNKIYTATSGGWANPETPIRNIFYIILETQNIYTYDDDNETLVSVGGGAGGGDSAPIGQVSMYAGSTAPDGFLMCDGSAVSRETYKDLYRVIGTTYGTGDGSTTFNLPNIKGRVVVMLDSNDTDFDTLGKTGGSKELEEHRHGIANKNDSGAGGYGAMTTIDVSVGWNDKYTALDYGTATAGTGDSGNLQPYIVLNYIIKATKVTPTQAQVVNTYSDSTQDTYSCDYINDYVIILTTTASKTLNAGEHSYMAATVPSTPSGYTSLGGFISNWNGSQDTSQIMVGGGGGSAHAYNYASVSQTVNITFTYIYVRTS